MECLSLQDWELRLRYNLFIFDHIVSHRMIKMAGDIIVPSLTRLCNLSLSVSGFPSMCKKANVGPIFKKNYSAVQDNYRPESLLSCVFKLF